MGAKKFGEFFPDNTGIRLPVTPFHVGNNAFEWRCLRRFAAAVARVGKLDFFFAAAIEHDILNVLR